MDAAPVPLAFCASTVNVIDVPGVIPETVALMAVPGTVTWAPVEGMTMYWVIVDPPFDIGGLHTTTALVPMRMAETFRGAPGTVVEVPHAVTARVNATIPAVRARMLLASPTR